MIDEQLVGDAGATIVCTDKEGPKAELVHDSYAVPGHGALCVGGDGVWFGGLSIATEVRDHDGVFVQQLRRYVVPCVMRLWKAMEKQEGWEGRG